mmetsp:Transcript_9032/g.26975  ORF Transcript_9032/g.26975 Transcript_9032/m.26975 type:complete len:329 (-) Transcript_9032:485-1471(-)|eukprot:CAMPEP_0113534400 /NCGR_PEP_ID=MMETSP0015_2-20120614/5137_1 /TAXON_ID=2838 /ORGANISM="Odontella" /LENGTH=328 /DNA_ID=CAMNT_0000433555 /DNA_START=304 /DNA_END=1290 /DNA_ORIENTATION=+ /assembly_acc=CAM_ASM_000160
MGDTISSFLFQPPIPSKLKEDKILWLDTKRGKRIPAFYIQYNRNKADAHSRSRRDIPSAVADGGARYTLLYSHANAEDLGNIYPWCKFLSKTLQVNVFAYDYTGYGLATTQGEPTEEDCYADIDAAYNYVRRVLGVPPRRIVLYGRSLGTGPSCYLAARTADESSDGDGEPAVGGVILHAPFMSIYRVVLETGCTLPGDKFPNVDFIPHIRSPLMVIHGTKDNIVPFTHSEQLLKATDPECRATPLFVEGMGHNNVHPLVRPYFVERISEFLEQHVRPNESGEGPVSHMRTEAVEKLVARGYVPCPLKSARRGPDEGQVQTYVSAGRA